MSDRRSRPGRPPRQEAAPVRPPIILAKPNSVSNVVNSGHQGSPSSQENVSSTRAESPSTAASKTTSSKAASSKAASSNAVTSRPATATPERPVRLLTDSTATLNDSFGNYLDDNTDFLVIGVVGQAGVIRSHTLDALAPSPSLFRSSSSSLYAMVDSRRLILLDSPSLASLTQLDKLINEKRDGEEALESVIIASLQMLAFLMNICHGIVVVDEGDHVDADLAQMLCDADMLRPSAPCISQIDDNSVNNSNSNNVVEYTPHLVFVHNQREKMRDPEEYINNLATEYTLLLASSRLKLDQETLSNKVNVCLLSKEGREEEEQRLRETVLSLPRSPLNTSAKLSERAWLGHAQRVWENVKTSSFFNEYARALRE